MLQPVIRHRDTHTQTHLNLGAPCWSKVAATNLKYMTALTRHVCVNMPEKASERARVSASKREVEREEGERGVRERGEREREREEREREGERRSLNL